MKVCKRGHEREDGVIRCKDCGVIYHAKYVVKNREKHRLRNAKYRGANREAYRLLASKWRTENPEKHALKQAKWRTENPEKAKLISAKHIAALSDAYVVNKIVAGTNIPREMIPPELIQAKRTHLKLARTLKEKMQ